MSTQLLEHAGCRSALYQQDAKGIFRLCIQHAASFLGSKIKRKMLC